MVHLIHSHIDQQLLAAVVRPDSAARTNAAGEDEILQVSLLNLPQGRVLSPHRHLPLQRTTTGTAESWVLVQGHLNVQVFDTDKTLVESLDLVGGECFVLYRGGHAFTVVSESAMFYEIKNGPYYGPAADQERF
jgi:cupin fold WbuC family metalloprotein